ncbi:MAG: IS701 family transposase [Planctomycetota bacterium]|jgi:SRSO17 transposase
MDVGLLESLGAELERFARQFDECIKTRPSQGHFRRYIAGQLSDLPRKSAEPIALQAGVPPRTLQEFLSIHRWDDQAVRDRLRERVATRHADPEAIGIIDETSFPKKGDKTPGVQRQHCGASGKTDNCVVTVHLGYAAGDFHTLLDGDLYLPEKTWHEDRARCREAGIPDDVWYQPKWRIALDLLETAVEGGLSLKWLCADEEYGCAFAFRQGVADLGLYYVVEIPRTLAGWLPSRRQERSARPVHRLWRRGGPSWERWKIKDTEKGPSVWEVRAVRICLREERIPGDEQWLLIARNVLEDEVKYFLSNAPKKTPLGNLLKVAFSRWHIERLFRVAKQEAGLDHFEGRRYTGLKRHLVLTSVSLLFLAEQRERLTEKKGSPSRSSSSRRPSSASSIQICRLVRSAAG